MASLVADAQLTLDSHGRRHHRAALVLLLMVTACGGRQKPPMEYTNPDFNRCGGGACVPAAEWMSPGPNPCPCVQAQTSVCQREMPWPVRQAQKPGPHVEVTHSYPQWPWPATYQSSAPVFFVRVNRIVEPKDILSILHVADNTGNWRQPQAEVVRCLVEETQDGGFTSVFFRMTECIPPNSMVTWSIGGGDWRLGPPVAPEAHNGSYLYEVFRTHDPQHAVGSEDPFWNPAQLVSTHGEAVTRAKLQEQGETMELLRRLGMLSLGSSAECGPATAPVEDEQQGATPAPDGTDGAGRACQQATAVYVTDVETRQILRMAPDGSNVQVLVSGVEANDIDIDIGARKMYWTDHDKDVMRANLDGSGVEVLLKDMPSPYCLALDLAGQRLLWTNQLGNPRVQSSTLEGADVRDLVPGKAEFMIGISVDHVNRALYWMDGYYKGHVVRAYVDGGNPKPIATTVGIANGIDVDPAGGKVYSTEYGNGPGDDVIRRANLDGSNVETLFDASDGLQTPQHIAVDPTAGKIYWADLHAHRVQRGNLDGTGLETIREGMGYPRGVALVRYPTCEEAAAHVETDKTASPTSWASPFEEGEPPPATVDPSGAQTQGYGIIKGMVTLLQPQVRAAGQQDGAEGLPTPEYVEAVAKQQLGGIRACYERELMRSPSLAGKVLVEATIDAKGVVSAARIQRSASTLGHASAEACILKAVQRMRFPKVRPDGGVIVRLPLVFSFTTCTRAGVHSRCSP